MMGSRLDTRLNRHPANGSESMFRNKILDRIQGGERAPGLFMAGDYMESVNVFWNVKGALEQLLYSHGRRSRMNW